MTQKGHYWEFVMVVTDTGRKLPMSKQNKHCQEN